MRLTAGELLQRRISAVKPEKGRSQRINFAALVRIDSGRAISTFLEDSVLVDKNLFISDFKTFQLS